MSFIQKLSEQRELSIERKAILDSLIQYCSEVIRERSVLQLNFICTHNSRRSQLAEFLTDVLSTHFNLPINAFSGGTEESAFYPSMIEALRAYGLDVSCVKAGSNPHYKWGEKEDKIYFSKKYDHPTNPSRDFAAIMVCDSADSNCPFVPGAEKRFALKFKDPKAFDNTEKESKAYADKVLEIGGELYYIFSQLR